MLGLSFDSIRKQSRVLRMDRDGRWGVLANFVTLGKVGLVKSGADIKEVGFYQMDICHTSTPLSKTSHMHNFTFSESHILKSKKKQGK